MTARDLHAHFAAQPGAEQIASAFALRGLQRWIARRRPAVCYEVGGGIGCLSAAALLALPPGVRYRVEESEAWCRTEWVRLARPFVRGQIVEVFDTWAAPARPIDLLLLDGGPRTHPSYWHLARRAVVFVEGRRREQRRVLRTLWAGRRPFVEAEWRPAGRSKGYAVLLFEPTPAERAWFSLVRLREWARDLVARLRGRPVGKRPSVHPVTEEVS